MLPRPQLTNGGKLGYLCVAKSKPMSEAFRGSIQFVLKGRIGEVAETGDFCGIDNGWPIGNAVIDMVKFVLSEVVVETDMIGKGKGMMERHRQAHFLSQPPDGSCMGFFTRPGVATCRICP